MRELIKSQLQLGEQDIGAIHIDARSRDDIPRLLRGLQFIYTTPELREQVFAILSEVLPQRPNGEGPVSATNGRPGMTQWSILVLSTLRLGLNTDYDRTTELANQHRTVRQMLGHSDWSDGPLWHVQTLKDNLRLFTPEVLERINQVVVEAGHNARKKSPDDALEVRCDSFVVETNVHYPTDINLLADAIRKVIATSAALSETEGLSDWRQSADNQRCVKKAYRRAQQLKRSSAKDPDKRAARQEQIREAHADYLALCEGFLERAKLTRIKLQHGFGLPEAMFSALDDDVAHAERQIDQIRRRVLQGERIPHSEKVFSIFEPHTEWISKGKAGVPVELGLRVTVSEDPFGFVLNHRVMQGETDDQVAVPVVKDLARRYPSIASASFDKGYHSPANQQRLAEVVDFPVLPKKGKCSASEHAREHSPRFERLRRRHSAVESAINALEAHGLDRCPDHGIDGFKRYVALAVVARNLHRLGAILLAQDAEQEKRERKRAA
ncbi:MAG: ISNCY family transposase [Lamprobacter sp.]|uniref:ISNCY family transposase n=1 Tax=Lamprobacter sp. TaxID=3100796 RepID=UPI002B258C62|nr:ISNCY family transposase [Lamprobacter sp.]MEA3643554.1 ISNCY family transposase [Lamprobacter sp.]